MKINKKLVPIKGHYFLLYAGLSPISPFVPILIRELGYTAFVVGIMFTIVPLLTLLSKPVIGGLADKFQCHNFMFSFLIVVQGVFFFILQYMPSLPPSDVKLSCGNDTLLSICLDRVELGGYVAFKESEIYCQLSCPDIHSLPNSSEVKDQPVNFTIKPKLRSQNKGLMEAIVSQHFEKDDTCLHMNVDWLSYNNSKWFKPSCEKPISSFCNINCNNNFITEILKSPDVPDSNVVYFYQFWIVFAVIATAKIAMTAVTSIGDAICFNLLGDRRNDFGLQRLWGAAGWGSMALISSFLVDKISEGSSHKNYSVAFYIAGFFMILDFLLSLKIKYTDTSPPPKSLMGDLAKVINNRHMCVFMMWCTVVGIYSAVVWNFLFWFIQDVAISNGFDTTYIKTLQGLTLTMHCYFGEIPFFFFSGWILKTFGHRNSMLLVLLAFAVRFMVYSFLTNPWWILPVETLNGITFGVFYSTMATYASSFAQPGTESTIQSLVCALYDGLGVSLGSFIGGYMMQVLGGNTNFLILGISAIFFSVMLLIFQLCCKQETPKKGTSNIQQTGKEGAPLNPTYET